MCQVTKDKNGKERVLFKNCACPYLFTAWGDNVCTICRTKEWVDEENWARKKAIWSGAMLAFLLICFSALSVGLLKLSATLIVVVLYLLLVFTLRWGIWPKNTLRMVYLFADKDNRLHLHPGKPKDLGEHGASWFTLFNIPEENYILAHDITGKVGGQLYYWVDKEKRFRKGIFWGPHGPWQVAFKAFHRTVSPSRHLADVFLWPSEVLRLIPTSFETSSKRNWIDAVEEATKELVRGRDPMEELRVQQVYIRIMGERIGTLIQLVRQERAKGKSRLPKWVEDLAHILDVDLKERGEQPQHP